MLVDCIYARLLRLTSKRSGDLKLKFITYDVGFREFRFYFFPESSKDELFLYNKTGYLDVSF